MYSVLTMIGVAFAVIYLKIRERGNRKLEADIELAFVYSLIGAIAGAKLLWLLTCFGDFISELQYLYSEPELFMSKYLYGGFVFYGGLFGSFLALWIYCRCCGLQFFEMARIMLPAFPLIHGFGRIGCFCMGCCYGRRTQCILGVTYSLSEIAPNGVKLIPVQLYEAFAELILFALLTIMSYKGENGRKMCGTYLILYGLLRFVLEFFRGDDYRGFIACMSVSQLYSIVSVAAGLVLAAGRKMKNGSNSV